MRKFIFWEFPRASWQYDVMVGLILAFIFLTPRELFRDQPRALSVVMLPPENGFAQFWLEPALLTGLDAPQRLASAHELLKNRTGKHYQVKRLEPIFDSEQDVKGYMAYATE
ncbi:MAG TPA: hypothetical protein VM120_25715 [Bryobacteraceae bacterium]|nr:hypothetical protein [Bryobacteraceae bacterium]